MSESDLMQRLRRGSSDLSGQAMEEAADRIEALETAVVETVQMMKWRDERIGVLETALREMVIQAKEIARRALEEQP